jgi:hypothetical protein
MMKTARLIPAVAMLSAALAACSSATHAHSSNPHTGGAQTLDVQAPGGTAPQPAVTASSTPAPTAVPDACTLITRSEAEKILGTKLQAGDDTTANAADGVASCNYNAPVTGPSGQLGVYAQDGEPDALKTDRNLGHTIRTVSGIGDQTLEEPDNGSIFIRKGSLWVFINVPISTPPAALISAARTALARLP